VTVAVSQIEVLWKQHAMKKSEIEPFQVVGLCFFSLSSSHDFVSFMLGNKQREDSTKQC